MVGETQEPSIPDLFCTSVRQTVSLLNSWKNVKKALGLCTVVIAYDPDSTIHGALYGCSHACLKTLLFKEFGPDDFKTSNLRYM